MFSPKPASCFILHQSGTQALGRSSMISFRSKVLYGSARTHFCFQLPEWCFNTFWSGQPCFSTAAPSTSVSYRTATVCSGTPCATHVHIPRASVMASTTHRKPKVTVGFQCRYAAGEQIGYILGRCLQRLRESHFPKTGWQEPEKEELTFSPEAGWDDVKLKTFAVIS